MKRRQCRAVKENPQAQDNERYLPGRQKTLAGAPERRPGTRDGDHLLHQTSLPNAERPGTERWEAFDAGRYVVATETEWTD
jgi:hypothetical protein